MAINIFQGGRKTSGRVNSASSSTRAKNLQSQLSQVSSGANIASDSGATAVKSGGILGKIGNLAKKVIPTVAKFAPGVIGSVAKVAESVWNDPEWWQTVPGEGVTLNQPLAEVTYSLTHQGQTYTAIHSRPAILAFSTINLDINRVFTPSRQMVTQYLMPEIRKVVNAVPLQSASAYSTVLATNASIYALWRNFKRYDYMLKHGHTYIPNLNSEMFPILQVENASYLQATINRLEEYLRANVRLPHTLCEYLAWRFGRVYKVNDTAKSALVCYNVLPMNASIRKYSEYIQSCMDSITSSLQHQAANADLYNVYFDHDLMVDIKDETQFTYDMKEFALRTNLDVIGFGEGTPELYSEPNLVAIDSELDNPTTFMASTVSTFVTPTGSDFHNYENLFPVTDVGVYLYAPSWNDNKVMALPLPFLPPQETLERLNYLRPLFIGVAGGWATISLDPQIAPFVDLYNFGKADSTVEPDHDALAHFIIFYWKLGLAKACEYYNAQLYAQHYGFFVQNGQPTGVLPDGLVDMTALSMDLGLVPDETIASEQIYAFANLCDIKHKASLSYKAAEKLVAKDVANTVENMDIATSV